MARKSRAGHAEDELPQFHIAYISSIDSGCWLSRFRRKKELRTGATSCLPAVSFSAIHGNGRSAYHSLGDHEGVGKVLQHRELPGKAQWNVEAFARVQVFKPA